MSVAIETYGQCLDNLQTQHAATRTSNYGKTCNGAFGIVVVHIPYAHHRVYGYARLNHGIYLGIVVQVLVGHGSEVLCPAGYTHNIDKLVYGAALASQSTTVAQSAKLHIAILLMIHKVGKVLIRIIGWKVFPIACPDGFLAVNKRVARCNILKIRIAQVVYWLHYLSRHWHGKQHSQQQVYIFSDNRIMFHNSVVIFYCCIESSQP